MKSALLITVVSVLTIGLAGQANAVPTLYFNEANYLADLSAITAYQISEGFESSDWDPSRDPAGVPVLISQGLTWVASDSISTGPGWARSGNYGVFDSWGDPDNIYSIQAPVSLVGVGGWFDRTTAQEVSYYLDGVLAGTLTLTDPLGDHQFFGVIDVEGFNIVNMSTSAGHWGADDFTFGAVPEPATLFLLGGGLLGAAAVRRRRRNKE